MDPFVARQHRKPPAPSKPQIPVFDQEAHNKWIRDLYEWQAMKPQQRLEWLAARHNNVGTC